LRGPWDEGDSSERLGLSCVGKVRFVLEELASCAEATGWTALSESVTGNSAHDGQSYSW
jgi:hypothetical protein